MMAAKEISVKKYVVRLSGEERERLEALIRKGKSPAQRLLKARILLKADVSEAGAGWSDSRISSLPIFVITAAELAAQPVANRKAMPLDCLNSDFRTGQRINLMCFSRPVPDPRGRPCQNDAPHQLRSCRQSSLASMPSPLSP
jgi:hypothetical protein